ncbi:Os07g0589150 [Oryza sativa Japonica Group]|uniref:Os07g0589150 protein n=1 Tax=Oryza sativa subsp. japonica TaxID=39947 RepID=A0A0P0X8A6_ORYSJ|nr:Os07g0589150 [Oryza sativa Japonica Group]
MPLRLISATAAGTSGVRSSRSTETSAVKESFFFFLPLLLLHCTRVDRRRRRMLPARCVLGEVEGDSDGWVAWWLQWSQLHW